MDDHVRELLGNVLSNQSGIISRAQAVDLGAGDADLRRLVRQRRLVRVHPGVFADHTGPLTWLQRAWAATLYCAPSALRDESAVRAADGPGRGRYDDGRPIQVAIDHRRRLRAPVGIDLGRVVDLGEQVLWNASPPRQRLEHAVLRLAAADERDLDAVARLADAVGARMTTADRLRTTLAGYGRIGRRAFLESVLDDVANGTCSALEHGYVTRVERPHGLPVASRQFRESIKGRLYRDAVYLDLDLIVELDGRGFHTRRARHDADLERDSDARTAHRSSPSPPDRAGFRAARWPLVVWPQSCAGDPDEAQMRRRDSLRKSSRKNFSWTTRLLT